MNGLIEAKKDPASIEEYPLPWGVGFGAAVADSFWENPGVKAVTLIGNFEKAGEDMRAGKPRLTREEALDLGRQSGVSLEPPEEGYYPSQVEALISRQKDHKLRRQQIEASGLGTGGQLAAGLIGSIPDPLNIAASFIPFGGEAYWASKLARPGISAIERAGVRAAQGVVQGAAGAAVLEPLSYATSQALQDDYTLANSFMNVVFGAGVGALAHVSLGAIVDRISGKYEMSPMERAVNDLDPRVQAELRNTAIVQAMEDRPIDVTPIVRRERVSADNRARVAKQLDPDAFTRFEDLKLREEATRGQREAMAVEFGGLSKAEDIELAVLLDELNADITNPALTPEAREAAQAGKAQLIETYGAEKLEALPKGVTRERLGEYTAILKASNDAKAERAALEPRISGAYEKADRRIRKGKVKTDEVYFEQGEADGPGPSVSARPLPTEIPEPENFPSQESHTARGSAFVNRGLETSQSAILADAPPWPVTFDDELTQLKASNAELLADAKAQSKLAGIDDETFDAAFQSVRETEKAGKEFVQVLDDMAACLITPGEGGE